MELHPLCSPLAFLLGTWKGTGQGEYPTIDSFGYNEEVVFGHVGKSFLTYSQKTRHRDTGLPLHAEVGYLRAADGGQLELVVVQPSGIVEIHSGHVVDREITLELNAVHVTNTAKSVTDVTRSVQVDGPEDAPVLRYEVAMAAVGQPLTHHLSAELVRQPDA